jgi:hypothetical protein
MELGDDVTFRNRMTCRWEPMVSTTKNSRDVARIRYVRYPSNARFSHLERHRAIAPRATSAAAIAVVLSRPKPCAASPTL